MPNILTFTPLYALLGLVIAILGYIILKLSQTVERRCTLDASGYILDNKQLETKPNGKKLYYPIVAYEINDTHYTVQYRIGTKDSIYTPKDTVKIKINPDNHSEIFIMTEKSNTYEKSGEIIMLVGLILFVIVGAYIILGK